jgi:hypothetical protein
MLKRLYKLEDEITEILEKNPITRTDDHLLYVAYWNKKAPCVSFLDFWKKPKKYGGSSFSAVERCRRKIQERRPELKDSKVAEYRNELTLDYEQYAIGG